ncbi:accessory Sec system S-layer assembly protein [Bacillus sp. RIT 809]|uniref:accessory Sec system S-layer assembly protein n=1 Tax=Bacillus sp. RIT 809 TaxID=2803857 RepID=UPI00194ED0B6|nr:accessory Sec system S-layer assembly protein [Bacillus sp. RIT 809]MBM6649195.1 accessory Sec system S-layer assembly protein [Bacillus sp. RIT 809]
MLSFLKRAKKKGKDTVVSSSQLLGGETAPLKSKNVKPTLYFHPSWGEVAQEQKYIYQFLHKSLPSLQENQISLAGIEAERRDNTYYITTFIRNSVSQPISFETITLLLLNKEDEICARKTFNLSNLEDIPSNVNMPWTFTFEESTMTEAKLSAEGWQLAFEFEKEHTLDLDPAWAAQLADSAKEKLQELVAGLTPPKENELNFLGLQARLAENNGLHTTILLRNGHNRNITLEQLPLHISDATGNVIAKSSFNLKNFEIKANSTKPWTFTFPTTVVAQQDIDLSTWTAFIPK